jgi:hypothetical protein
MVYLGVMNDPPGRAALVERKSMMWRGLWVLPIITTIVVVFQSSAIVAFANGSSRDQATPPAKNRALNVLVNPDFEQGRTRWEHYGSVTLTPDSAHYTNGYQWF